MTDERGEVLERCVAWWIKGKIKDVCKVATDAEPGKPEAVEVSKESEDAIGWEGGDWA